MAAKKPKFDWTQFTLKVGIKASPEEVFRAWTDQKIITKWFPEKALIEPKKGGRIYFEWLAGDKLDGKVISIVKNKSFVFPFGPNEEQVAVTIKKDGKGSICELHQYNMKTTEAHKWNMNKGCSQGWTFFLANLKVFLEHGIDLRSHDPKRSYRNDYINS